MRFYLTMLRSEGKRLAAGQVNQPPRLVITCLSVVRGVKCMKATCCYGGMVVGELWEPMLVRLGEEDLTVRGVERLGEAAVVQEWQLRPHFVAPVRGAIQTDLGR